MSGVKVFWPEGLLADVHCGHGVGQPLQMPSRRPTRSKLARDVSKVASKYLSSWQGLDTEDALRGALQGALANAAKADTKGTMTHDVEAIMFHMLTIRSWKDKKKPMGTPKSVRLWFWAQGPAFAVESLVVAWRLDYKHALHERVGDSYVKRSEGALIRSSTRTWSVDFDRDGDAFCLAFKELRALMTLATPAELAAARAAAARLREGASLELRIGLSYLFPGERDWGSADARELIAAGQPSEAARLLIQSGMETDLALGLFHIQERHHWMSGPLLALHGVSAVPALIQAVPVLNAARKHAGCWSLIDVLACIGTPEAASFAVSCVTGGDKYISEHAAHFFKRFPQLSIAALHSAREAGGPAERLDDILQRILTANPELDPNAVPIAATDKLPVPLQRPLPDVDTSPVDAHFWEPASLPALHLRGGLLLGAGAVEQLGFLLRHADGARTPAVETVLQALEPGDRHALALSLWEGWGAPADRWASPLRSKWVAHAVGLLGDDASAKAISQTVRAWSGTRYNNGLTALQALKLLGSSAAWRAVNDLSQRARSKGLRKAAMAALSAEAESRGLSLEAFTGGLTPTLELETPAGWSLSFGARSFTLTIDGALNVGVVDAAGKARKSLPRASATDDKTSAAAARARLSSLKKSLKTIKATLSTSLEQALVTQTTWSEADWRDQHVSHPLMVIIARHLLWRDRSGFFALSADHETVGVDGQKRATSAPITLAHPVQLDSQALLSWRAMLGEQLILQLGRPHRRVGLLDNASAAAQLVDRSVSPRDIRRLIGARWDRGPVEDNGYFKQISLRAGDASACLRFEEGLQVSSASSDPQQLDVQLTLSGGDGGIAHSELLVDLSSL